MRASKGNIAFIGAGSIGGPMAERLLETGRSLIVCDPSPRVRAHFSGLGCLTAASAAEIGPAEAYIFMVANDAQLASAAADLAAGLDGDSAPLVLIMSTVLPETVLKVAEILSAKGARVIDAPVSGGSIKARQGALSIMVGGDIASFEDARSLLGTLSVSLFHCGPLGSGQLTKILNNLVGVTNLFLFSEAMRIAQRLDLDIPRLVEIMERSSGRNAGTRDWRARQELFAWNSKDLDAARSVMDVTRKDLHHALIVARQAGVPSPLLDAVVAAHDATPYEEVRQRWHELALDQGARTAGGEAGKPTKAE